MKSARLLGKDYGVNAQEMNRILVHLGMLEGEPGNYYPTEKAEEYVREKYEHRGCGGYPSYNRYYTERSYNDSIKELLDAEINDELIDIVREELREARRIKREELAAREEYSYESLSNEADNTNGTSFIDELIDNAEPKDWIEIGLLIAAGVVVYKAAPHVKKWWNGLWEEDKEEDK